MTNTPIAKTGHGGWRGGGRPKKILGPRTVKQEKAKNYLQKKTREKWQDIIDAYFALGLGHFREKVCKDGKKRIYTISPDRAALNDLVTRVIGKPIEELSGNLNLTNVKETQKTLRKLLSKKV